MATSAERLSFDSSGRQTCALFTPLPPLPTGVATYALRIVLLTRDIIDWRVFFSTGSDPSRLPADVTCAPIADLRSGDVPGSRVFMLGNSPECFEPARALLELGGCGVFHETVMHHMLRHCCLAEGRMDLYRRLLGFDYGPGAGQVEKRLSKSMPPEEYDTLLKRYPLIGSLVHASDPLVCLNQAAASVLGRLSGGRRVFVVGHPLDPIDGIAGPALPDDAPLAGMVGGWHPGRNVEAFMEALHILRTGGLDIRGALIGGGWPDGLPGWIANTGRLDEPAYQGWIRRLSVAVDVRHPTCNETSGSLLEVMRAGVPAVVTASGPSSYLPSDCVVRIPAPPSPTALASAIRMILEDRALARALSAAAVRHCSRESFVERARSEWTRIAACRPERAPAVRSGNASLSAALHDPPPGFTLGSALDSEPISWAFEGMAALDPPEGRPYCLLTAWGSGRAGAKPLPKGPAVLRFEGRVVLEGRGRVSQVTWTERP